jgi:hypothetical protein
MHEEAEKVENIKKTSAPPANTRCLQASPGAVGATKAFASQCRETLRERLSFMLLR